MFNTISLIIPVRNRRELTRKILGEVFTQVQDAPSGDRVFAIVVDDGSTDGTPEMIATEFPLVHLIAGDGNLWWCGAIVKGMEYALSQLNTDYVVWLNDDQSLDANFINNLMAICRDFARMPATIFGGIIRDRTYPEWIVYGGFQGRYRVSNIKQFIEIPELEVDVLSGNIVVISSLIVDKIGFPDYQKLPHHGSDFEYIMRAKKAGIKIILTSKLQATTDYQLEDFIRYMPYWLQWYLQPSLMKKWEIIKGLTSYKANHSIWQVVALHSDNRHLKTIPPWKYFFCYLNKIIRLFLINFASKKKIKSKLDDFLECQNPPQEIIDIFWQQCRLK